jgi:hypothetical protein
METSNSSLEEILSVGVDTYNLKLESQTGEAARRL